MQNSETSIIRPEVFRVQCNQNPRRKRAAYLCVRQSLIALGSSLDYHGGLVQERAGVVQVRAEDQGHQDHPEDAAKRALSNSELGLKIWGDSSNKGWGLLANCCKFNAKFS